MCVLQTCFVTLNLPESNKSVIFLHKITDQMTCSEKSNPVRIAMSVITAYCFHKASSHLF